MSQDMGAQHSVEVAAPDDLLIRVLAQHRPPRLGWNFRRLDGPVEPGALVIIDYDDSETQTRTLDAVRAQGFAGPVVLIGGCDGERLPGDESVPRPVKLGALLSRIDAHWQKSAARLGPYALAADERILRNEVDGSIIRLTELEQDVLIYLSAAEGALIGREQLLADIWRYGEGVDSHTVETHIWRLRQKLETDDPATRFLVTEAGGYRLLVGRSQDV